MKIGYIFGPIMVMVGAGFSSYVGMLLVKCASHTGRYRYEDIALYNYGPRMARFTSILNLIALIGFLMSYITYVKTALPSIVSIYATDPTIIKWLGNGQDGKSTLGHNIWAMIFSFCILLPLSIPRNGSKLQVTSFLSILCSTYLALAVFFVFFTNKDIVEVPWEHF